jgi:ABC-2 type transport system permease protein
MKNSEFLWKNRVQTYLVRAIGYLRLILNSGFIFSVYATFIIATYFYAKGLKQLPDDFPAEILLVVFFTLYAFIGQVRTFVQPADPVFLLPSENKLKKYFLKSYFYSLGFHAFYLLVIMVVALPIYLDFIRSSVGSYIAIGLVLLLLKAWNLALAWQEKRLGVKEYSIIAFIGRILLSLLFVYGLVNQDIIGVLISLIIIVLYFLYGWYFIRERHTLKWDKLIEIENRMLRRLYRVANLFTDVPEVQNKVKARKFISSWITWIPFGQKHAYFKLFMRTFFRANDYFPSYIRLVIIGSLLLLILPKGVFQLIFLFLFLYMSSVQLLTIWQGKSDHALFEVYPVPDTRKLYSFQCFVAVLIIFQGIIFSVVLGITGAHIFTAILFLIIGVLYAFVFANWNVKRFINKTIKY